ncbi:MAG: DNA helicase RecQ [Candidatus Promineifilaceae bacterium]|nr:DNA helicase RecQ [Candidatus Promineifilaceae bacterium]
MKVLIVAKTRRGPGACVGALSFSGQSLRLESAAPDETAGLEYEVGEVWEVTGRRASAIVPPHTENFIVATKDRLAPMAQPAAFIERHMPPVEGDHRQLYEGRTGATKAGALYVTERLGVPDYSTLFWRPDQPLTLDASSKRLRYRYPTADGGRTLTFVGFQEPLDVIAPGTLLRVSLAHWWRPEEMPEGELRCYVQLSGWFLADGQPPGDWVVPPDLERDLEQETSPFQLVASPAWGTVDASEAGPPAARRLLKSVFGFDDYWPLQEQIVANLLDGQDTLAVMPTGSGKSLCYQLPALLFPGLTVVVSPLISLMQDQVDQLRQLEIPAVYLNSTLPHDAYQATMDQIRQGVVKLLYVAPETLLRPEIQVLLQQVQVDCLTVDEAHCISAWGHDFRPEYRQLHQVRQRLTEAVAFALTATATERVRTDIKAQLGMPAAATLVASFDRPNLMLAVQPKLDGGRQLRHFLEQHRDQSGIIYCATRRQVDHLAQQLAREGWSILPYHAGLDAGQRQHNQRQFVRDRIQIIVATVAFGMGINKPNVRFVVHYDTPENLESYYQQIGRAGRDGLRADCLFLFGMADVMTIRHFIAQGDPAQQAGAKRRLKTLIDYAETGQCRRKPLLAYFGESYAADGCGLCDNCLAADEADERVDVTEAAQKFLSCVVRTKECFGANHIIKVLRGSRAKAVLSRGHDRLSTYNIGREYSTQAWRVLAGQFIQQGLLARDARYGGLALTEQGRAVLQGQPVMARPPEKALPTLAAPVAGPTDVDVGLLGRLKEKRMALAEAAGVPPYVIFHDRSLEEMATALPQSETAFADIYGVGRAKLQKYADPFLTIIRSHCAEKGIEPPVISSAVIPALTTSGPSPIDELSPRVVEVARAYNEGESPADLAARLSIKPRTILGYLRRYTQAGQPLRADGFRLASTLSRDQQAAVLDQFARLGPAFLRPVYEALDGDVPYDELRLLRLLYLAEHSVGTDPESSS